MMILVSEEYRLKKMARMSKSCNRILDVGWADMPNRYLSNAHVTGLDINTPETPENYEEVIKGDAMLLPEPFPPGHFDGIIAGEILEHLEAPCDFLRGCHKTLAEGGMLILSTPNPLSPIELLLNVFLTKSLFYATEHVMLYPQRWLIRIMELSGFNNVKLFSGGFPLPGIGLVPVPRFIAYQSIVIGFKPLEV